jgi:hypothetical protein
MCPIENEEMEISKAAALKLEGVYMLVQWPASQLIMDEEWFDSECHLADTHKAPELGNSAYFVPVKRLGDLETKLKELKKKYES